jgi:hypothetical protein
MAKHDKLLCPFVHIYRYRLQMHKHHCRQLKLTDNQHAFGFSRNADYLAEARLFYHLFRQLKLAAMN